MRFSRTPRPWRTASLARPGMPMGLSSRLPCPPYCSMGMPAIRSPGPDWGEHTDDVLRELGITTEQVADYRAEGVVK